LPERVRRRDMRMVWLMLRACICGDGGFYAVGNNGSFKTYKGGTYVYLD
jgi:hypothetical protein